MRTSSILGKITNRFIVGLVVIATWGLATGIAAWVFTVPFTGSFADLGTGLANIWTAQGFVLTVFWLLSMIILGVIAYAVVKHRRFLEPYKAEKDDDDLPRKPTLVYFIILAAIISFLLFLVDAFMKILNANLGVASIQTLYSGIIQGNIMALISFTIFTMVIGIIVVWVAGSGKPQKLADDAGINKV